MLHPDGYVKIKDRSKDVIISGGENISSIEVEDVLHRHPAVMLAAVVALPDAKWGEVPCAFVELKPGAQASEPELVEFCRGQLARFKVPKRVVFVELPKVGRVLKIGEEFGVIESVKSTSPLYAPVAGEVTAINDAAVKDTGIIWIRASWFTVISRKTR